MHASSRQGAHARAPRHITLTSFEVVVSLEVIDRNAGAGFSDRGRQRAACSFFFAANVLVAAAVLENNTAAIPSLTADATAAAIP